MRLCRFKRQKNRKHLQVAFYDGRINNVSSFKVKRRRRFCDMTNNRNDLKALTQTETFFKISQLTYKIIHSRPNFLIEYMIPSPFSFSDAQPLLIHGKKTSRTSLPTAQSRIRSSCSSAAAGLRPSSDTSKCRSRLCPCGPPSSAAAAPAFSSA